MTVNMQILRLMNGHSVNRWLNNEIAGNIHRPVPSVRRATAQLTEQGLLRRLRDFRGQRDYTITAAGRRAARA